MLDINIGDTVTVVYKSYGDINALKSGEVKSISPKRGDITVEIYNGKLEKFDKFGNNLNRGKFFTNTSEILDRNSESKLLAVIEFRNKIKINKLKSAIKDKMEMVSVEKLEQMFELLSE